MFEIQKLIYNINNLYDNKCIITNNTNNTNNLIVQSIIPYDKLNNINNDIMYSKFNYLLLNDVYANEFFNFQFTIHPDPINWYYIKLQNGKYMKAGKYRIIINPLSNMLLYNNINKEIVLLYNSRVFIKWHFIRFFEVNNLNPLLWNVKYTETSNEYIMKVINNISNITNENILDKTNDVIMIDNISYSFI